MASSLHLIWGDDEYLVTGHAKELVNALVPEADRTLGLEAIDARAESVDDAVRALSACVESLNTIGLFAQSKVTWLRDATMFGDSVVGRSPTVKALVEDLTAIIKEGIPTGQVLVISAVGIDKRFAFYKACAAAGQVKEFSQPAKAHQAEQHAVARLKAELSACRLRMSGGVQQLFLGKAGTDSRQIANEVAKLSLWLGPDAVADASSVERMVCASRAAIGWDLADAFGRRDLSAAVRHLRQLLFQKESPIGLVMSLQTRIRDLLVYREAMDAGRLRVRRGGRGCTVAWEGEGGGEDEAVYPAIGKDPRRAHPFYAGKLAEQAARFSVDELKHCQTASLSAHEKLVSSRIPPGLVLESLLAQVLPQQRGPERLAANRR